MSAFNIDQIIAMRSNALTRSLTSYAITFFGFVANGWLILTFAGTANLAGQVLLALSLLATAIFSSLAIPTIWSELTALRKDKADGLAGTAYEAYVDQAPFGMFSALTVITNIAIVAVGLWAIFG